MTEKLANKVGSWSFIIGVLLALCGGMLARILVNFINVDLNPWIASLLIVMGLIVGFLNITGKESAPFLLAAVSLVIVVNLGSPFLGKLIQIGPYLESTLGAISTFVMAATIVVALKAIYNLAKDE